MAWYHCSPLLLQAAVYLSVCVYSSVYESSLDDASLSCVLNHVWILSPSVFVILRPRTHLILTECRHTQVLVNTHSHTHTYSILWRLHRPGLLVHYLYAYISLFHTPCAPPTGHICWVGFPLAWKLCRLICRSVCAVLFVCVHVCVSVGEYFHIGSDRSLSDVSLLIFLKMLGW